MQRDAIGLEKDIIGPHFNRVWNESSSPWNFKTINKLVIEKKKLITPYLKNIRSIIDLGCGGGEFLSYLIGDKKFNDVYGVDIARNAIIKATETGIYTKLIENDIGNLEIDKKFDLVLLNEVIYYPKDYLGALENVLPLVNKNGRIIISIPIGPEFFSERKEAAQIKNQLKRNRFVLEQEKRIGYTYRKIPLRFVFWKKFPQTHKLVLIYKNG